MNLKELEKSGKVGECTSKTMEKTHFQKVWKRENWKR